MTYNKNWNFKHTFVLEVEGDWENLSMGALEAGLADKFGIKDITLYSDSDRTTWILVLRVD